MPTPSYTPLATVTLGSTASSVTFSSIPATYRDLIFVVNGQTTANANITFRINGDTGSNYPSVVMVGGSSATSASGTYSLAYITDQGSLSGSRFMGTVNLMDYSATDKHKTSLVRSGYRNTSPVDLVEAAAIRWANTSAITTIAISTTAGSFAIGSTFNLFGVIA
jgi:hypothetical protein